ncbi:DoxX family protein [Actinomadura montaniterrae]|uniref:DoxX family protein n=1 Tax=Actinomadura montaniterrae TaxID=1803903 RepID=A0A6L3VLN4_9ACTN|nr:DoxX family protein [Actinomadura montaniterrae]KAB2362914.1 DoxX family protein [Actinomadura montaniterrae]
MTVTQILATPATGTVEGRRRVLRRALWAAQSLIAAFLFFASAMPKFAGQADAVETFTRIGWGQWFRYVTGAVEAAGAIGLVVPRLAGFAATALIGLLAGAVLTHLLVLDAAWALFPAALAAVCAVIAWDRRAETRDLLRSVAGLLGR